MIPQLLISLGEELNQPIPSSLLDQVESKPETTSPSPSVGSKVHSVHSIASLQEIPDSQHASKEPRFYYTYQSVESGCNFDATLFTEPGCLHAIPASTYNIVNRLLFQKERKETPCLLKDKVAEQHEQIAKKLVTKFTLSSACRTQRSGASTTKLTVWK